MGPEEEKMVEGAVASEINVRSRRQGECTDLQ
jgi:hypothetical protein